MCINYEVKTMKHTVRYEQLRIYTADLSFEDNLGGIEESIAE